MKAGRRKPSICWQKAAGDTSSPDVYDLLGDAYSQHKNYAKAEEAYRKAVDEDPDDPGHLHGLAQALLAQDKYAEALEQYQEAFTSSSRGPRKIFCAWRSSTGGWASSIEAEASLLKAKQLSPGSIEVLYNEALLYEDEGRYDDAVKVLTDAIAGVKTSGRQRQTIPTRCPFFTSSSGTRTARQQRYPAAIRDFPGNGEAQPGCAKARPDAADRNLPREPSTSTRAIAETKKALDASPKDPGSDGHAGDALRRKSGRRSGHQDFCRDCCKATTATRKFISISRRCKSAASNTPRPSSRRKRPSKWPAIRTARRRRGSCWARSTSAQKKFDLAEQQFRKVLDANPNNAAVLNYYGYMLADRGIRLDEATSHDPARRAAGARTTARISTASGWAYYKQNKLTEAEEYLRKAVDRAGHDPTILSHLGDVYLEDWARTNAPPSYWNGRSPNGRKPCPPTTNRTRSTRLDAQLKTLKKRLAQKASPDAAKPQ